MVVQISVVALRAVLHTGSVCQGKKRVYLGIEYDTYLPTSSICSSLCTMEGGGVCGCNETMSLWAEGYPCDLR